MRKYLLFWFSLAFLLSSAGCGGSAPRTGEIDPELLRNFAPAPAEMTNPNNPITPEKVALGRMLYYDERLSKSQTVSCNSCHALDRYGVDGQPVSTGVNNQKGNRNAPTVYFAAGHIVQFWDGRASNVEEQAKGPVLNPVEMAMPDAQYVEKVLRSIPEYVKAFQAAFPGQKQPVTFENAALAIAAFERKLATPSRWDKFLSGDQTALTAEEKAGFLAFHRAGCQACHNGPYLGGRMYQKLGLVKPWPSEKDLGRYEVTKQEHDKMVFKVPSLRNIEKTGPYFHDGSASTLEAAVRLMSQHQVERPLTETEIKQILAWMRSLTGELPVEYIRKPELPPSTPATPKPVV